MSASAAAAAAAPGGGRGVSERRKRYLLAPRQSAAGGLGMLALGGMQPAGFSPLSFDAIEQALRNHPDIDFVGSVGPRNTVGALSTGIGGSQGVLVARMTEQNAARLYQQGGGHLMIERDQHLVLTEPAFRMPPLVTGIMPGGPTTDIAITVLGRDNQPVPEAEVSVFGSLLPVSGVTDANGQVTLALPPETARSVSGLYVKPKSDHWSFYQRDPDIGTDQPNVVGLRPLSDWAPLKDFPQRQVYGWGQKAMRLDQLPQQLRGQGIKVAVIDSGAATTHQNLEQVRAGVDIMHKSDAQGWTHDELGHGSHCSAVIAGAAIPTGMRGFAPDVELHECKLFPGGQISQLIDALEYCVEQQIDVVNLSLGGVEPSEALEQQIVRAKRAGVACIVAAGNSGNAVQYPASSPNVMAVAAIGKLGEFPPDSYHAQTLTPTVDANGYFQASFSCFGPQVGVCAPGVAIASAVPPNNFAAWDGTSMAAPHITGLAALVLAHHPEFQSLYKFRGPERVERLFQVIKMSARPVTVGEPGHIGHGLPDVLTAVGLQPAIGQAALAGAGITNAAMAPASLGGAASPPITMPAYGGRFTTPQQAGLAPQTASPLGFDPRWPAMGSMQGASMGNPFGRFW
jgi:subtilisin family serine protease